MKIFIAPMAGVTDYTFRSILSDFNPDVIFTEMVSINSIDALNEKTLNKLLRLREGESVQIFGNNLEKVIKSVKFLESKNVKHIDLNAGCPMAKIVKNGYGAALVGNPEMIKEILITMKKNLKPETTISLKIRVGYKGISEYVKIAKIAEEVGCTHITVHGRTREQMYTGKADWSKIKEIKESVKIPVIGNGDIFSAEDAIEKINYSKVDGIMLARGICGNPWLIREIREKLKFGKIKTKVTAEEKIDMAVEHIKRAKIDNDGNEKFIFEMRKHIGWYLKGIRGSSNAKNKINKEIEYLKVIKILEELRREQKIND